MKRDDRDTFRYRIYGQKFFTALALAIARRCGTTAGDIKLEVTHQITQFELWEAMREVVDWFTRQGIIGFSRSYHDPAEPLTPSELAADLVELACWRAGEIGYTTRLCAKFPRTPEERDILLVLHHVLCMRLFEGADFGREFEQWEAKGASQIVHTVLRAPDPSARASANQHIKDRMSVAALELLFDEVMPHLAPKDRRTLALFLEGALHSEAGFITKAVMSRMITQFFCMRCGAEPRLVSFPPLFAPLKKDPRKEDFRKAPTS